jgi:hypothetical protein
MPTKKPLKAILDYWDCLRKTKQYPIKYDANGKYLSGGGYYQDQTSEVVRQEIIEGNTEIELFEKFYKLNNSLRYCNGSYYKFVYDKKHNWEIKYKAWINSEDYKKKSFDLYYGGGVVD